MDWRLQAQVEIAWLAAAKRRLADSLGFRALERRCCCRSVLIGRRAGLVTAMTEMGYGRLTIFPEERRTPCYSLGMPWIPPEEYYKNLPRKWMATNILLFNSEGKFLIVKPTYRDHWLMPGGLVDANESPTHGAIRELQEEIGLVIDKLEMVCVAYHRDDDGLKGDRVVFVFDGGLLSEPQIGAISLGEDELSECRFVALAEALPLLGPLFEKRIPAALQARTQGRILYLEL
jgi:8-oxo-dGTP pyrophosphatase MutT (NUDIX family)